MKTYHSFIEIVQDLVHQYTVVFVMYMYIVLPTSYHEAVGLIATVVCHKW